MVLLLQEINDFHYIPENESEGGILGWNKSTSYMIDLSKWVEFELYDLFLFWSNHYDNNNTMLVRCLGVSHRFGSALCYWIMSKKGMFLSHTTINKLTDDKPRDPNVQEQIHDYHVFMEVAVGCDNFGTSLDGYYSFINDDEEDTTKGNTNGE